MDPVHTLPSTINDDSPYIWNMPPSTKSTKPCFGFQKETMFKPQKVAKIAKYHYFLKLVVFFKISSILSLLRNIQQYTTFLKLEFKKIESHK